MNGSALTEELRRLVFVASNRDIAIIAHNVYYVKLDVGEVIVLSC